MSTVPRDPRFWGFAFLAFTIVAVSHAAQSYAGLLARAPELASWGYALVGTVPFWYAKLLLLPVVVFAGTRWRISDRPLPAVSLHFLLSLAFSAAHLTLGIAAAWAILPPPGESLRFSESLRDLFSTYFVTGVVFYWVFLGTFYALDYARQLQAHRLEARELALRASELQTELAEARLQTLRSQLNPHFLFNALNAVGALCDRGDTHAASRMVTRIGDLLRMALERPDQLTTLHQEMRIVDTYIDVEQVRIGSRLTVERHIDQRALGATLPSLLLQPIVENAVRHGVGKMPGPAAVRISARLDDDRLHLSVEDSGPGFDFVRTDLHAAAGPDGVGLRNSIARLEQIYGAAHDFNVGASDLGGARVEIVVPSPPA